MFVEYIISVWKGRQLLRDFPETLKDYMISNKTEAFRFYRPLLFSGGIAVIVPPAVNASMGYTFNITLAIASFALGLSIQQLALSFFMYLHQIVLQFYNQHAKKIIIWSFFLSLIPGLLLGILLFSLWHLGFFSCMLTHS